MRRSSHIRQTCAHSRPLSTRVNWFIEELHWVAVAAVFFVDTVVASLVCLYVYRTDIYSQMIACNPSIEKLHTFVEDEIVVVAAAVVAATVVAAAVVAPLACIICQTCAHSRARSTRISWLIEELHHRLL